MERKFPGLGNNASFPRITTKFPLEGTSSLILSEICIVLGQRIISVEKASHKIIIS
jgi:hypothetical protein